MLHCARAHAFIDGRDFTAPEDVKTVFPSLARHRLEVSHGIEAPVTQQISDLLDQVPVP